MFWGFAGIFHSPPPSNDREPFILWLSIWFSFMSDSHICGLVWSEAKHALGALHCSPRCLPNRSAGKLVICRPPPVQCLSLNLLVSMNHPCLWSCSLSVELFPVCRAVPCLWSCSLSVELFPVCGAVPCLWSCSLSVELFPVCGAVPCLWSCSLFSYIADVRLMSRKQRRSGGVIEQQTADSSFGKHLSGD